MNEYRARIHQAIGKAEEPLRLLQSGKLDRKTALTLIHKLDWQKAAVISLGTAAVASAAFGERCPAVDGNVYRVLTRLTDCPDPVTDIAVKHRVRRWAESAMPYEKHDIRLYNQATMDLGATVCIPVGTPRCEVCPMAEFCLARLHGTAESRPVRAPKKPRKAEDRTVFLLIRGREAAFCKRPPKGLLAGLWEFPNVEGKLTEESRQELAQTMDRSVERMAAAFELLECGVWQPVIESVVYAGLYQVGNAVLNGTFHQRPRREKYPERKAGHGDA